jgi:hypothetical protein
MIVKGFTYHKKGDSSWINPPTTSYKGEDGETKYNPIVWFPDKQRFEAFQQWCLKKIDRMPPAATEPMTEDDSLPF